MFGSNNRGYKGRGLGSRAIITPYRVEFKVKF